MIPSSPRPREPTFFPIGPSPPVNSNRVYCLLVVYLAPSSPNSAGLPLPGRGAGLESGCDSHWNALELPLHSLLAHHKVPCRSLVAAGGDNLALPTGI